MDTEPKKLNDKIIKLLALGASSEFSEEAKTTKTKAAESAPGQIAGAGLGYLVLVGGGYYVVRRWRKQKTGE